MLVRQGFENLTGSRAVPGNRYLEALPRRLRRKTGGRASGSASPGRAGERGRRKCLLDKALKNYTSNLP